MCLWSKYINHKIHDRNGVGVDEIPQFEVFRRFTTQNETLLFPNRRAWHTSIFIHTHTHSRERKRDGCTSAIYVILNIGVILIENANHFFLLDPCLVLPLAEHRCFFVTDTPLKYVPSETLCHREKLRHHTVPNEDEFVISFSLETVNK